MHKAKAAARRSCQGGALLQRAPEGLVLDGFEHGGILGGTGADRNLLSMPATLLCSYPIPAFMYGSSPALTDVHPNQITAWKALLEGNAANVFDAGTGSTPAAPAADIKALHAKIGELTLENDFLEGALQTRRDC